MQKLHVTEGDSVNKAEKLVSLSTNYQGGNAPAVGRQIAQRNAQFNNENFTLQKETIADPLWRGLGGAIISGLLVSSTIMLLFIPVLYYSWMKSPSDK